MRLTPTQIDAIHSTTQAVLGEGAKVWLYGSRLDDGRHGGDIDLLIESAPKASFMDRALIKYRLETALALPVDVMAAAIDGTTPTAFETIARKKAVLLTTAKAEV
jgi:predicted nucleotidyltransferase